MQALAQPHNVQQQLMQLQLQLLLDQGSMDFGPQQGTITIGGNIHPNANFNPKIIGGGSINIGGNINSGSGGHSTTTVTKGAGLFGGAESTQCVNGDCQTVKEEDGGFIKGITSAIGHFFGGNKDKENEEKLVQLLMNLNAEN